MKILIFFLSAFSLHSCIKIDCEEVLESIRNEECLVIVERPPDSGGWFSVKGIHPYTHQPCKCRSSNKWWESFSDQIIKGDTIFKRRGDLIFNIHKKDTIISEQFECTDTENRFLKHWGF